MADPAVEARARAIARVGDGLQNTSIGWLAEVGADEALRPIRELHDAFADYYRGRDDTFAAGVQHVLRDLRELVYSSEELDR